MVFFFCLDTTKNGIGQVIKKSYSSMSEGGMREVITSTRGSVKVAYDESDKQEICDPGRVRERPDFVKMTKIPKSRASST